MLEKDLTVENKSEKRSTEREKKNILAEVGSAWKGTGKCLLEREMNSLTRGLACLPFPSTEQEPC